jgi:hypothetical protein
MAAPYNPWQRFRREGVPTVNPSRSPRGLQYCLPFSEGTWTEVARNVKPTTKTTAAQKVSPAGRGLNLTGGNGLLSTAVKGFTTSSKFTLECWFYQHSNFGTSTNLDICGLVSGSNNGVASSLCGIVTDGAGANFLYGVQTFGTNITVPITTGYGLHQMVLTFDGTTLSAYFDGKFINSTAPGALTGTGTFLSHGGFSSGGGDLIPTNVTFLLTNVANVAWNGSEVRARYNDPFGFLDYPQDHRARVSGFAVSGTTDGAGSGSGIGSVTSVGAATFAAAGSGSGVGAAGGSGSVVGMRVVVSWVEIEAESIANDTGVGVASGVGAIVAIGAAPAQRPLRAPQVELERYQVLAPLQGPECGCFWRRCGSRDFCAGKHRICIGYRCCFRHWRRDRCWRSCSCWRWRGCWHRHFDGGQHGLCRWASAALWRLALRPRQARLPRLVLVRLPAAAAGQSLRLAQLLGPVPFSELAKAAALVAPAVLVRLLALVSGRPLQQARLSALVRSSRLAARRRPATSQPLASEQLQEPALLQRPAMARPLGLAQSRGSPI